MNMNNKQIFSLEGLSVWSAYNLELVEMMAFRRVLSDALVIEMHQSDL